MLVAFIVIVVVAFMVVVVVDFVFVVVFIFVLFGMVGVPAWIGVRTNVSLNGQLLPRNRGQAVRVYFSKTGSPIAKVSTDARFLNFRVRKHR